MNQAETRSPTPTAPRCRDRPGRAVLPQTPADRRCTPSVAPSHSSSSPRPELIGSRPAPSMARAKSSADESPSAAKWNVSPGNPPTVPVRQSDVFCWPTAVPDTLKPGAGQQGVDPVQPAPNPPKPVAGQQGVDFSGRPTWQSAAVPAPDRPDPLRPPLPTFLVIGAMKAGTTSLWNYLREHPQVFMPDLKEFQFFSDDRRRNQGLDWYRSHFA